jgi:hypothetical protein
LQPVEVEDVLPVLLALGVKVRLRARGHSMAPAIRNGDAVIVSAVAERELEVGQVGLFRREGRLFAHRLVARHCPPCGRTRLVFAGDNNAHPDPPIPPQDLLAAVVAVERRKAPARQVAAAAALWLVFLGVLGRALGLALALVVALGVLSQPARAGGIGYDTSTTGTGAATNTATWSAADSGYASTAPGSSWSRRIRSSETRPRVTARTTTATVASTRSAAPSGP